MQIDIQKLVNFFFEIGTLKNIPRSHVQFLPGANDSLASHIFRVTFIGLLLSKLEKVDENKVIKMCLLHDLAEIRTGDANFLNAFYRTDRKENELVALLDQLKGLGFEFEQEMLEIFMEYEKRETDESIVAKDADSLDQIFLQIENFPANSPDLVRWHNHQAKKLKTVSAQNIAKLALGTNPLQWLYAFSDSKKEKK